MFAKALRLKRRSPAGRSGWTFLAKEVAHKQHAKSRELRAATNLACLWQQQGKQPEGHKKLSEVYNCFTKGFETKDLQEAKALLEALGEMAKWGNGEKDKG